MSLKSSVLAFVLLLGVLTPVAAASNLPDLTELILVPLSYRPGVQVAGAKGTIWQGEVWVQNSSDHNVALSTIVPCPLEFCEPFVRARFTGRLTYLPDPDPGVVFSLAPRDSAALTFSSRVFEITRRAQPQGIQLPVVRSRDFIVGETSLLGIPTASVRTAVRVYDPLPSGGQHAMSFRVEALADDGTIVGAATLNPQFKPISDVAARQQPSFDAIYDLAAAIPAVNSLGRYHLHVVPIGPQSQDVYWVMASVTDNETQQVLLITPQ